VRTLEVARALAVLEVALVLGDRVAVDRGALLVGPLVVALLLRVRLYKVLC
jgi:hypothetical protein